MLKDLEIIQHILKVMALILFTSMDCWEHIHAWRVLLSNVELLLCSCPQLFCKVVENRIFFSCCVFYLELDS
jgi:hypothetical protein